MQSPPLASSAETPLHVVDHHEFVSHPGSPQEAVDVAVEEEV
jgi:hypothetical protein